ncbi:hypothetical protein RSW97_26850, partial [Escherichia coli]|nr:hypothetical protein [Escherichia coli]
TKLIAALPDDWRAGRFVGRIDRGEGPCPILVENGQVFDMSRVAPTVSALLAGGVVEAAQGEMLGELADLDLSPEQGATNRL